MITLKVIAKEYLIQNIQIHKYKTKTNNELERILNEKKEIINAKKDTYKVYPDFNFIMPAEGTVTGVYGTQRYYNGKKGNFHNGHDIAADSGSPVYAPSSGKVVLTGNYYYNGKFIMINHGNNLISMFLHLNDIFVTQDQIVKKGEIIGSIGSTGLSTGPHLHWSVLLNNTYINPLALVKN
jgi:murein DD-endopeptidase MepM/ murein hydrolase activator NlpD